MKFEKNDTNLVKGIAIFAMVFHHLYPNNPGLTLEMLGKVNFTILLAQAGKVCVPLLTLLSGFGMAESFKSYLEEKDETILGCIKFCFSHYVQLLYVYWGCLIFELIFFWTRKESFLGLYGSGVMGGEKLIIDAFGLAYIFGTDSVLGGWYLTTIVIFYFLFPIIFDLTKKLGVVMLVISYIPWIYYIIMRDINIHTDWWVFYIFSFVLGIYLSQREILAKFKPEKFCVVRMAVSIILLGIACVLRVFITLPVDTLVAFCLILLAINVLTFIPMLRDLIIWFGTKSARIWLLHGMFIYIINTQFTSVYEKFIYMIFLNVGIAEIIDKICSIFKADIAIKKIRGYLK